MADSSLTPQQKIAKLRVENRVLEDELHSAKGLGEEAVVDSARARSRIRRMGEEIKGKSRDLDEQIHNLEWSVELAQQERAKLLAQVEAAQSNLESTTAKYAQLLQQKKAEQAEHEALLRSELQMYQTELESLREFQSQRTQMEEELRHLDQSLVRQRQVHQETMEQFETQLKREGEHYQRENARRIHEAEQAAVDIKDQCLEQAAIRCIQDSQTVSKQLKRNQMKSRDILSANAQLVEQIEAVKRDNTLLTGREKMLVSDVAKYKQKIDNLKLKMSEDEVSYAKKRAQIETDSSEKIDKLERECIEVEKDNESLQQQLDYLTQRAEELEGQQRMSNAKQSQLMKLITSTAPLVLDSLKSSGAPEDSTAPLQALIEKLDEAVKQEEMAQASKAKTTATTASQTTNPNMKYF